MLSSSYGSTPPQHPTHNVRFSIETIEKILSTACPGRSVLKIESLPSGKSFNNRIYFIDVSQQDRHAAEGRDADVTENNPETKPCLESLGTIFRTRQSPK
jgi:hypothetical protein